MKSRALIVQQQDDAPPALVADWALENGVELEIAHGAVAEPLPEPDPERFSFVVTLGSDASAGSDIPWVRRELEWLTRADERALPILGICFGAQALAVALGGAVRRAPRPEIGWVTIASDDPELIEPGPWFTWHEDVIELPSLATEIARNEVCVQAFSAGPHLGVQFHPEVTEAVLDGWFASSGAARQLASAVTDEQRLRLEGAQRLAPAREAAFRLLDAFASRIPTYH
jgi:GMP synthase-like glutamine amidotransferase